jgi:hypothetical protein
MLFFKQIEKWDLRYNYFPEFQNYFTLYFRKKKFLIDAALTGF